MATGHSWERLNNAMRGALKMAVGAGFEFKLNDITHVIRNYRSSYWIGESDEWVYADAISVDNTSAIKSYEHCRKREPFIAENVNRNGCCRSLYMHGGGGVCQKSRLAVGFSFTWNGQTVKVTSFADDQLSLTACSYKDTGNDYERKIDKRYTITRAELLEGRAMDRERKRLLDRARSASDDVVRSIIEELRVNAESEFFSLPVEKIRQVVDKHVPPPPHKPRNPRIKSVIITKDHIERARAAGGGCQADLYKPGMSSSDIKKHHREWLIQRVPDLALDLGIHANNGSAVEVDK